MQKNKIKNFFPGGNTTRGFYSFYKYIPYKVNQIYIIKGGPGTGKSTLMKKIGKAALKKGYNIEFHWCSSDNDSLDGIVIPAGNTAILDGTAPHIVDPKNPGAIEEIIYLGKYWDQSYLRKHRHQIKDLNQSISIKFERCYRYLKIAKSIYEEWKNYYREGLNYDKANKKTAKLINEILPESSITKTGSERHLFGSAITPEGYVNHFENIAENIENCYFIKGKPGTGKSTLIKKLATVILENGYEVLYLHWGFDPESIDTIVIPELNTAVINSNPPYIVNTKNIKKEDHLTNMSKCIEPEIINNYRDELQDIENFYYKMMDKAISILKSAKLKHDQLEKPYITAMNFDKVEEKRLDIQKKILN